MSVNHYARIAHVYDAFVQTDFDIQFFVSEAARRHGDILELMAGTGRLTIPLLKAGLSVTAVDYSAEMLAILEAKLSAQSLAADVHQADIRDFDLGRQYPHIWIPFQAFPELIDEQDQLRALQQIHAHLTDDGAFICTLHNPTVRAQSIDGQLRLAVNRLLASGDRLMVWLMQTWAAHNVVEVQEFFEQYDTQGVMTLRQYSSLQFRLLAKADFEQRIEHAGFEVSSLYGNYDRSLFVEAVSPFMIWMLKKRGSSIK